MLKKIFSALIFINLLFSYYKVDPISIALSGSYNTMAQGYHCVGINPSNLAFSTGTAIGLFNVNFNISNNFLTYDRINKINGADLDNSSSSNYFPKEQILGYLEGEPISLNIKSNFPFPFINFSNNQFAISSEIKYFSNFQFSQDIFEIALEGNELNRTYDLSMENSNMVIWESSFTKAFNLKPIAIGFTIRYLKGLLYYNLEPIQDSFFETTETEIEAKGRYLLKQNTQGNGISADLGFSTQESKNGWKFGLSFINLFGRIRWNKETFLDEHLSGLYDILPYEKNEQYLINLNIEDLNLDILNDINTGDIFQFDTMKVYEVSDLPQGIEGEDYYCANEDCNTYLVPSDNVNPDDLNLVQPEIIKIDYPTYLSIGASKKINDNKYVTFNLLTGLDEALNNSKKWRVAMGYVFGGEKFPLRLGTSYGGDNHKSIGMGFGLRLGGFNLDLGLSTKGSFDIRKSNALDFGINIYWLKI